jgi:protein-disulfide isomerase
MTYKNLVFIAFALWSGIAVGKTQKITKAVDIEYTIGRPNAPVTFYEYGSLTCHICSHFYQNVLPKIQKDFPEIKVVVRLMSFDKLDMAASKMILHSSNPHALSERLYKEQDQWMAASNQIEAVRRIALNFGMGENEIEESLQDKSIGHTLLLRRIILKAKSAPLFRIGKSLLPGLPDYDKYLKPMLERVVKRAKEGKGIDDYDVLKEMADEEKAKQKES